MIFSEIQIIEWYDDIIKAFCINDDTVYYCTILALDPNTEDKVYLFLNIKYLRGHDKLRNIIETNTIKESWAELSNLIQLNKKNETFIAKARDLQVDQVQLSKYKINYNWPKSIIWGEFPQLLLESKKIDNWWSIAI
ncbi:hypothetical protein [Mucilaginibacter sp. 22184]|uniref:hypothetical protein n=1 Tax=Mucilaginibacter sp. 22184 TaxID=3453887 RepID=UPI003F82F7EE